MFNGDLSKVPPEAYIVCFGGSVEIGGIMAPRPVAKPDKKLSGFTPPATGGTGVIAMSKKSDEVFEGLPDTERDRLIALAGGSERLAREGFSKSEKAAADGRVAIFVKL